MTRAWTQIVKMNTHGHRETTEGCSEEETMMTLVIPAQASNRALEILLTKVIRGMAQQKAPPLYKIAITKDIFSRVPEHITPRLDKDKHQTAIPPGVFRKGCEKYEESKGIYF